MADEIRYDGKRVIVTGAASGMGEQAARIVGELGGEVYALDVKEPTVPVAKFLQTDLADTSQVDAAVDAIGDPVHALFNCAGLPNTFDPQQIMRVNFCGHRHLTERVIPLMPRGSAIAFISSAAGMGWMMHAGQLAELVQTTDYAAACDWCEGHGDLVREGYAFSKEAIIYYVSWRAAELLKKGIRINCTSPGPTDTAMMPHFEQAMGKDYFEKFPKPIGRNATALEQAWPIVFLNSDAAAYIAGHNLFVDGGFSAGLMTGQIDPSTLIPEGMEL